MLKDYSNNPQSTFTYEKYDIKGVRVDAVDNIEPPPFDVEVSSCDIGDDVEPGLYRSKNGGSVTIVEPGA